MDGVLFLSNDCHETAFAKTAKKFDLPKIDYKLIAGMKTVDAFNKIASIYNIALSENKLKQLVYFKQQTAPLLLNKNGAIADYCNQLILNLKQKYKLALASSASRESVAIFLSKLPSNKYF